MSSTNVFPCGLSKWVDTDKPERMDFVNDNRLLDENAMWKAGYDADNAVADAGGIAGYIQTQAGVGNMATSQYDPDGLVAAGGGIPAFVGAHTANKANPHAVTKAQVGLGSVDNAQQATKAEFNTHVANKANPHAVTKAQVGLGNVANSAQMPIAGGTFTGNVANAHTDRNGYYVRDIHVRTSGSSNVATSRILMNRK